MHLFHPATLTFQPQNHIISRISQGHSLYQVQTLWDLSFLSYAADKQTQKQTDKHTVSNILPTYVDSVGRRGQLHRVYYIIIYMQVCGVLAVRHQLMTMPKPVNCSAFRFRFVQCHCSPSPGDITIDLFHNDMHT